MNATMERISAGSPRRRRRRGDPLMTADQAARCRAAYADYKDAERAFHDAGHAFTDAMIALSGEGVSRYAICLLLGIKQPGLNQRIGRRLESLGLGDNVTTQS